MAAPVTQDEISIGEQSAVSIPDCTILSSNLKANLKSSSYPKSLQIIIECLKSSVLMRVLTIHREIPKSLVNLAFSKATFVKENDVVSFAVLVERILTISKKNFIRLMGLPNTGNFITPTAEELIGMFNQMGCTPMLTKISQFKKNKLPFQWSFLFTIFKRCLCGRRSGLDSASQLFLSMIYGIYYNVNIDYGSILWYEFSESVRISTSKTELSSHRFWSVIVESSYSIAKIPFDTTEEPKMTFNEFQVPKKTPFQPEFEFVGQIPVSMIGRIPLHSEILMAFKSETSQNFSLRVIPEAILHEIQTQNVKVSLKRKEVAESSEIVAVKPKKKKTKLRKLVLVDDSEENEADNEGMEEMGNPVGEETDLVVTEVESQDVLINKNEQINTESPVKQTKRLKKAKKVITESHTQTLETLEKSKKRRQRLTADLDDDVLPISQIFSIAPLINVINPIAEEQEGVNVNEGNMELDVQNLADETAQDAQMIVHTEAVNEEVREGENVRIENDTVENEVAQDVVITTVEKETMIVESEGVNTTVSAMVVNEAVVTEVDTTTVSAMDVNEAVVTEVETTEVITPVVNEENDQSSSVPPPITHTVSEQILTPTSESSIFSNLRNLNVTLPVISPVVPPVTEEATILENISDGEFIGLSDDEEYELAPIPEDDDEMNDDTNDDQFISMKQFKILNHKMNMLIRYQDLPKEKEIEKEAKVEAVVLNLHNKIEAQSSVFQKFVSGVDDFQKKSLCEMKDVKDACAEMNSSIQKLDNSEIKDVCADIQNKIQKLEDVVVQGDAQIKSLRDEVLHLQGLYENDFQQKMDEAKIRKEKLQKVVDESLTHIRFLEASIKTYDAQKIAKEYNEKVVKHVEMVQQDFIARLSPLINFVKRIPQSKEGIPQSKEGISEVPVPKSFRKMDLHLFKSTADTSLPYLNPTTTAEPQTIVQDLSYPMVTQPQPEAAIRALDVAHRLSQGVVIGSSSPLMTTSTIVSTVGEGSSLPDKGKGKQVVIELSKEKKKKIAVEGVEKLKQQMSLLRQGQSAESLGIFGQSKIWTETTIRDVAFGDGEFYNMLPTVSYEAELTSTQQLDLPLLPTLFKVKCFMVKASLQLLSGEFEEKLIKFYGCVGKPETEVWNSKPIVRVLKVTDAGLFEGVFGNKRFKVLHTDNKEYDFTMANFPTMNPSDLIRLFKLFNCVEKMDVIIIVLHLKKLLKVYVEKLAEKDMIVSKELFVKLDKPDIRLSGISKEKDGKIIHKPEWGVVSSARVKGKIVKSFMRMDEKGLFENIVLESILRRINQNDENSVKDKRDVEDQLRWWLKVRKEMLDLIPVLYAKG